MPQPIPMISEGVVFASLSDHAKNRVIEEVGRRAAKIFKVKKDALVQSLSFRKLASLDRLDFYRGRTAQEWSELQQTFPEEYSNQIRDFYILERRISASQTRAKQAGKEGDESPNTPPNYRTGA